jgi:hypothetical protein
MNVLAPEFRAYKISSGAVVPTVSRVSAWAKSAWPSGQPASTTGTF